VIALIDYGAGNLTSVRKALSALGADFATPHAPDDLGAAHGIIVPGVGHFGATRAITGAWRSAIECAVGRGAALLGICVGMQWLFEGSAEAPDVAGFATFEGFCRRLDDGGTKNFALDPTPFPKVPHVGWNEIVAPRTTALLDGVEAGAQVYFTHSYAAPVTPEAAATTTYGVTFAAAVERGRIAGVQFHPEKSGDIGLRVLRNWLNAV